MIPKSRESRMISSTNSAVLELDLSASVPGELPPISIRAVSRLPILRAAHSRATKSSFMLAMRCGSTVMAKACSLLSRSRQVPLIRKGSVPMYLPARTAGLPE